MKAIQYIYTKSACFVALILMFTSCEREPSNDVEFATNPNTSEIFTDDFIGMGENFYFPFVGDGAKPDVFSVDKTEGYESSASIRIDVPNANDPDGSFAGFSFVVDGASRNLTQYDALTFWARSSQSASIGVIGFGEGQFQALIPNVDFTTTWTKFIVPIPDASKLIAEKGMFLISAGGIGDVPGQEVGYTFWLDEIKFESLGTIAQPRPEIFEGQDLEQQEFVGNTFAVTPLTQTFNLGSGINQSVLVSPSYFSFASSNTGVALVNESGQVSVIGTGTTKITASIAGVLAKGSLRLTSDGALPNSPTPTRSQDNVKSIFSDAYTAVTPINTMPNFGGSTTETVEGSSNGNAFISYANNNFTGIIFENTVDASALTHLNVDVFSEDGSATIEFQIRDIGANGEINTDVNTGFPIQDDKDFRFTATGLTAGVWNSIEIPLSGDIANQKGNIGAIILVNGPNFILDNIYFYSE